MDFIKEALGLGPGTFTMKPDMPAIPAGGFIRASFECRLKKPMDVNGVLARATATRGKQVVYEQTQRMDGLQQVTEARWTLVFRIPREIQLPEELLPAELRELVWTVSARAELGLKTDPEAHATFEVIGAFPDGVPVLEPGEPVQSGTSLERVVNVLAADTVSAANRVSERIVAPHATPALPDYEKGMQFSSLQAELEASRDAQQLKDKLGVQDPHKTQILESPERTRLLEEPPAERPRRVEKPPLRIDQPIQPRERRPDEAPPRKVEPHKIRTEPAMPRPARELAEPPRPRRVEKPPLQVDKPIKPRSRQDEDLLPRRPVEPPPPEPTPEAPKRRVEKPPVQVNPRPSKLPQPSYQSDQDLRFKDKKKKK